MGRKRHTAEEIVSKLQERRVIFAIDQTMRACRMSPYEDATMAMKYVLFGIYRNAPRNQKCFRGLWFRRGREMGEFYVQQIFRHGTIRCCFK